MSGEGETSCEMPGCSRKHLARGLCKNHYDVARRTGRLQIARPLFRGDMAGRLRHYSHVEGECIVWHGATDSWGYGKTRWRGRSIGAHRVAYELAHGPIPDGMKIDHMCHNPACVNAEHLRLATTKQNAENLRGPQSSNPWGERGVSRAKGRNKFRAAVKHDGRTYFLGHFDTPAEAATAARAKRLELFTHNDLDHFDQGDQ